jgi:hypothetical protein
MLPPLPLAGIPLALSRDHPLPSADDSAHRRRWASVVQVAGDCVFRRPFDQLGLLLGAARHHEPGNEED